MEGVFAPASALRGISERVHAERWLPLAALLPRCAAAATIRAEIEDMPSAGWVATRLSS